MIRDCIFSERAEDGRMKTDEIIKAARRLAQP